MEAAIETHGLRRVFKTRKRLVDAVVGVDLTVRSGEIFGFLGPNGAGLEARCDGGQFADSVIVGVGKATNVNLLEDRACYHALLMTAVRTSAIWRGPG